jgi:hypothetical protein
VRWAADDQQGADFGVTAEPTGKGANFAKGAEEVKPNDFLGDLAVFEKDEVVALWRRDGLGDLQKIQRDGQVHLGEAANFEAADAEENGGGEALTEKFEGVVFAIHFSGEDKDEVGGSGRLGKGEPSGEGRPGCGV